MYKTYQKMAYYMKSVKREFYYLCIKHSWYSLRGCKAYLLILHIYLKSLPKIFTTYSPRTFIISNTRVQSCANSYIAGKRILKERSYIAGNAFIEPLLYLSPMIDGFQYVWMNSVHVRRREKIHLL